ncbi:zinc ribbon domain-containing protein [Nitratireductor sp. XY-223]|uniref:zinc ribbon domain-containing protein n=1 Tax=Nitratireductor sp. XY-223 TaxID=2561926 RepID=UPI002484BE24|nr:zinc ribbon domain-containing protein [Nitratireductor sp. XY-223]
MGNRCQSCGMPLSKDEMGGGTNADGSISSQYCSYCFKDGKFLQPDFTAADMQVFCLEQLAKRGMPRFMAWIFTRGIPKLGRWQNP